MYGRIQTTDHAAGLHGSAHGPSALDEISAQPGFRGLYELVSDGSCNRLVTLWDTRDDAGRLSAEAVRADSDLLYEVRDDFDGVSVEATPTAAVLVWHLGPMSPTTAEIGMRARRRIAPTLLAIPGVVRMIALFQPDTQQPCLLTLITAAEVSAAIQEAAAAVVLPPEEEWTRTPDRVESYAVTAQL